MFRETDANPQMSLFDNPVDLMGKRAAKKYDDPKAWFNQFFALVTSQVDESVFKPLFKEGNIGAPTASIRRLVAMSVLKEGFGCSDEDLLEKLDYGLLSRKALGLVRIEDEAPSIDTYYLFRRRICEYADATGVNLMETCFSRLTGIQGRQSRYLLGEGEGGTVRITDTRTGEVYEAKTTKGGALRIPYSGAGSRCRCRYFTPRQLESMRSRKLMEDIPPEEKNKRNNVDASIFQLCFHARNNKTRYRGKRKHELWAFARCMWINLRRLVLFRGKMAPEGHIGGQNDPLSAILCLLKGMKRILEHLKLCFVIPASARQWALAAYKH